MQLPEAAPGMIARMARVTQVEDTGSVTGVNAYRSPLIPAVDTNALGVQAATRTARRRRTSVAQGRYLSAATAREPVAVLGAAAAQLLGIDRIFSGERIWVGDQWFYVTGILNPISARPRSSTPPSSSGSPPPSATSGFNGHPTTIYVRTTPRTRAVNAVDSVLAATANPENPG